MRRRRLIMFFGVLAFAVAGAWWLSDDRLSADERAMVGTWRESAGPKWTECDLLPDRRWRLWEGKSRVMAGGAHWSDHRTVEGGRWSARRGRLALDRDPSMIRRALRLGPGPADLGVRSPLEYRLVSDSADELHLEWGSDGSAVWTRAPAD